MRARGFIYRASLLFDGACLPGRRRWSCDSGPVGMLWRACVAVLVGAALAFTTGLARAADPQPYEVEIAKTGDAELDQAIADSSLLVSLREKAPVGPFALVGRARDDEDRFLTVLYGLGFYKGQVDVLIGGRPLDDPDLPDYLAGLPAKPPTAVTASIRPGPLFRLGKVTIEGSLPRPAREKLDLPPGAPAVAANVLAARERLLNALREQGYALATVADPIAILDLDADALDIVLTVDTGPLVEIGNISFQGLQRVNESFLRKRLLIHPGERYDPAAIEKARQNLASLGVFSSVVVATGKEPDAQGRLPVEFVVTERKRHAVRLNAAFATDLGASASVQWQDRNLLGNAEQLKLSLGFSAGGTAQTDPGYWGSAQFVKPDFLQPEQTLQIDMSPLKESLEAYDRTALTGSVSISRKLSERWTGSIGIAGERERVTQQDVTDSFTLASLPLVAKYDSTTDLFNPTGGVRATLSATPTRSLDKQGVSFVSVQASASTYLDAGAWFRRAGGAHRAGPSRPCRRCAGCEPVRPARG